MTSKEYNIYHKPVMLQECLDYLAIKPDGTYVDCTTGGGGHSFGILKKLGEGGLLLCLDKDLEALEETKRKFQQYTGKGKYSLIKSDFAELANVLKERGIKGVDGVLADFGVSSHQLDEINRGFGYMIEAPLDMRMDKNSTLTAEIVVNTYPQEELQRILRSYGEERYANSIARAICKYREIKEFKTTTQLADVITSAMPGKSRREHQHPAKRSFQAIRIEVNDELKSIDYLVNNINEVLNPGGIFAAISFHSLEDRIVKEAFRRFESPCICPTDFPICACGKVPMGNAITHKPVLASDEELENNPRSRSAKLRVYEKNKE